MCQSIHPIKLEYILTMFFILASTTFPLINIMFTYQVNTLYYFNEMDNVAFLQEFANVILKSYKGLFFDATFGHSILSDWKNIKWFTCVATTRKCKAIWSQNVPSWNTINSFWQHSYGFPVECHLTFCVQATKRLMDTVNDSLTNFMVSKINYSFPGW